MSTTYSGRILHTKKHNRKIHNCRTFITDDKHGGEKKHMEHTGRSVKKDVYIKISTANEICSTKTCCHFQNCFKIIPKWKKNIYSTMETQEFSRKCNTIATNAAFKHTNNFIRLGCYSYKYWKYKNTWVYSRDCQSEAAISGDFPNAVRVSNSSAFKIGGMLHCRSPRMTTTGVHWGCSQRAKRAFSLCRVQRKTKLHVNILKIIHVL